MLLAGNNKKEKKRKENHKGGREFKFTHNHTKTTTTASLGINTPKFSCYKHTLYVYIYFPL